LDYVLAFLNITNNETAGDVVVSSEYAGSLEDRASAINDEVTA
jgi:hypothetical protein